ncbi:hypothetical protein [Clostridium butyricum]|uniref:hypothetical protein n=1 Tax=Clostridium butyricum TaxID=1492 RepID=UPI00071E9EE6|nr:hypothetical protein [Clostridium butyricum]ALR90238.1 hypothetical protein ATN24_17400 [Clostridium butyricum]ALS19123.1 hypothetical protein ATD26_19855 [Clostridium butyricum]ANF16310.1 hypothetical protein AZ909_19890 [Clostridium butyricum]AOR96223.1 hypothetical protein BBB49_19360 [Clostridium butyricum]MCI3010231.1 hypothetical protein [Clostridium butyricum]
MKSIVVDGQLSLFDEQPKVVNIIPTKEENKDNPIFRELIDKYRDKCTRIVKVEKKLYVEIGDQTLSYEADGEPGGIFIKDILLRPKDEILVANEYKHITSEQIKTIKNKMHVDKFIKRKADNNVLIQYKNFCMAIYPNGHFAKWKSPAVYSDNEVYSIDEIEDINKINEEIEEDPKVEGVTEISESEETLRLGDKVKFNYDGPKEGNIVRIYNKGETVNVSWDNKQTAFYYKSVVKINA